VHKLSGVEQISLSKELLLTWEWPKLLINLEYAVLKKATALQWVITKIFLEFNDNLPNIETVANFLGTEPLMIMEGLLNLQTLNVLKLKHHADPNLLSNYELDPKQRAIFLRYLSFAREPQLQHITLLQQNGEFYVELHENKAEKEEQEAEQSERQLTQLAKIAHLLLIVIETLGKDLVNRRTMKKGVWQLEFPDHPLLNNTELLPIKATLRIL
jgi:hypothetical protein